VSDELLAGAAEAQGARAAKPLAGPVSGVCPDDGDAPKAVVANRETNRTKTSMAANSSPSVPPWRPLRLKVLASGDVMVSSSMNLIRPSGSR
jgi:hypothetical protein